MKTICKTLGFIAVIGFYYLVAGAPAWHTNYGIKLAVIYQFGAVMAFWLGDKRIGTLDPISLRLIFIALGVILMLAMFVLMFQKRDTARQLLEIRGHAPNQSPLALAATVLRVPLSQFTSRVSDSSSIFVWLHRHAF